MRDESEAEVQRVRAALADAIQLSGRSKRACERGLGLPTGYLTRILQGRVHLRFKIVLDICTFLGIPPGAFIRTLFPTSAPSPQAARILQAIGFLHPQELQSAEASELVGHRP